MTERILQEMEVSEGKAWESLSGYKFFMFGYHAAQWVKMNQLLPREDKRPNPFISAVKLARMKFDPLKTAELFPGDGE